MATPSTARSRQSDGFFGNEGLLAPRRCERQERDGGVFVLRSPEPLKPFERCVGEWLERWARETPDARAVAEPDADQPEGWRTLTWA